MTAATIPESGAGPATVQSRGRMAWYGLWQLRDYLINKGIATALISGLLLFIVWSTARDNGATDYATVAVAAFPQFLNNLLLFGVLFATNGIVSEDRKFGYYRFYFSKPVSVAGFYGQKFFVHLLGLMLVTGVMLGVYALVLSPLVPRAMLPVVPMLALGLGGIGFLLSAIFTLDWITLLAVYAGAQVAWVLYGDDPGIRGLLVRALPPVHEILAAAGTRGILAEIAFGVPVAMRPVWWIFLYGLACFFLGLVVVSRRKLATS